MNDYVLKSNKKYGLTSIEFFLSLIALFLLLIITYPILHEISELRHTNRIKENLYLIRNYSNQYFEEYTADSVSLYQFVGPRKKISNLKVIADEEYPKIIFKNKEISAYSKKYGTISVQ